MNTKQRRSEMFKKFQVEIKRKETFQESKMSLLELREALREIVAFIFANCDKEDFSKMPLKSDKTITYYLYHLTRIEDITSNTLIAGTEQILFKNGYDKLLNSPILTTGNELKRDQLMEFSSLLDRNQLKNYVNDVYHNSNQIISGMQYEESKTKVSAEKRNNLLKLQVVSKEEDAFWLVDYWCKKTYAGLLLMPFSRHYMLHLNGCLRIMDRMKYKFEL